MGFQKREETDKVNFFLSKERRKRKRENF